MNPRKLLIAGVLFAAVVASWLLLDRPEPVPETAPAVSESGYYLRDAVIEGMGTDGRRLYTLRAGRIVQAPADSSVTMEDVEMRYLSPGQDPWRLTATQGAIPAEGETIELRGDVTIEEVLFAGPEPTVIRAPELDVDLRAHLATTDTAVLIERGNNRITAVGLRADLKDRKLTLQSDVHGRFLP